MAVFKVNRYSDDSSVPSTISNGTLHISKASGHCWMDFSDSRILLSGPDPVVSSSDPTSSQGYKNQFWFVTNANSVVTKALLCTEVSNANVRTWSVIYSVDATLNDQSDNPISNAAVTAAFSSVSTRITDLEKLKLTQGYNESSVKSSYDYMSEGTHYPTTAGAKGYHWMWGDGTDFNNPEFNEDRTVLTIPVNVFSQSDVGKIVSIKADYSWNFAGVISRVEEGTSCYYVTIELVKPAPDNFYIAATGGAGVPEDETGEYWASHGYIWLPDEPGRGNVIIGQGAVAVGYGTKANELGSFASGLGTVADGRYSRASGCKTKAGYCASAEGYETQATELYSHSEGSSTQAKGVCSHAEGQGSIASGKYSHAEGLDCQASGNYSHAEGQKSIASGDYSHAEGGNNCQASGKYSHAEGQGTKATSDQSHAEGFGCQARGSRSHAEGHHTIAGQEAQHVEGIYNTEVGANFLHVRGNGSISQRKNMYTQNKATGDVHLSGDVYVQDISSDCTSGGKRLVAVEVSNSAPSTSGLSGDIVVDVTNGQAYICISGTTWKQITT